MRKSLFILFAALGLQNTSKAQITFTPEVGFLNWKYYSYTKDAAGNRYDQNNNWKMSLRAGLAINIPIGESGFSIEPGLYYSNRKWHDSTSQFQKVNDTISITGTSVSDYKVNYAELPINLKYSWPVGRSSGKLFVELSPYVSYAFSGHVRGKVKVTATSKFIPSYEKDVDTTLKFGKNSSSGLKALDYGLYAGIGYQFQMGLQIRMFYGGGIANISGTGDRFVRHGGLFGLSVGYVFGRKIPGRFY